MKKNLFILSAIFGISSLSAVSAAAPEMTFIGHASIKIKASTGEVIYIDPYYPSKEEYNDPADYILITHGHPDHNNPDLCAKKNNCKIIRWTDALVNGEYKIFEDKNVRIEAVPSGGNPNHSVKTNTGYIVTVDGISIYHSGDTSFAEETKVIARKKIDYALYPIDGHYTMKVEEAVQMADFIGAAVNIPIHGDGKKFPKQQKAFNAKGTKRLNPGQKIILKKETE